MEILRTPHRRSALRALTLAVAAFGFGGLHTQSQAATKSSGTPSDLLTTAERSAFQSTSRHEEVMALLRAIAKRSPLATLTTFGQSVEGRDLPLLIIADPPIATPAEAQASGKLVLFAFGDIHAGEVCGKEALQMLARDIALHPDEPGNRALLDGAVVLLAPIYNADGNERMAKDNRPGQEGPINGMGQRPNAQGLDLNRDWMKLEAPETRAMVKLLTDWNPTLTIDTHTTDGSYHQFALTYAAPQNPSGPAAPILYVRDTMLPEVSRRLVEKTGYKTYFYGNFNREHTAWYTYSSQPRFGCPYRGLRGQMAILSEAHAHTSFAQRVRSTLAFVRENFAYAVEHASEMRAIQAKARRETIEAGQNPDGSDMIGIRHKIAAFDEPVTIPGFVEKAPAPGKRPLPTGEKRDYTVQRFGRFEATLSVARPWGYLLPPHLGIIVEKLKQHGVEVQRLGASRDVDVAAYTVGKVEREEREFQGHHGVMVDATATSAVRRVTENWWLVRTAQPLGTLAVYLLEPESDDGLTHWNFLDRWIGKGREYPVFRVERKPDWAPVADDASAGG